MAIYLEDRQHEVGEASLPRANQDGGVDVASGQEAERLWSLGIDKLAAGDIEGAQAEAEKSLSIYESTDNFSGQADCQKLLGRIYEKQGPPEKAVQFYEAALRNYERDGNQDGVGLTLMNLSSLESAVGNYPQAILLADKAIDIYRQIGNWGYEAVTLLHQASSFLMLWASQSGSFEKLGDRGNLAAFLSAFWLAEDILEDQALEGDAELERLREIAANETIIWDFLFDPEDANKLSAKLLVRAFSLFLRLPLIGNLIKEKVKGNLRETLANEETRKRSVAKVAAEVMLQEGQRLIKDGAWQRGLEMLQKSLEQFRQIDNLDGKARAFLEIGEAQLLFGDYEAAHLSFLDAERLFKKLGRKEGAALAKLKLGTLALEIYQPEEARKYLQDASSFFHQHNDEKRAKVSDKLLKLADEYERNLAPL